MKMDARRYAQKQWNTVFTRKVSDTYEEPHADVKITPTATNQDTTARELAVIYAKTR